MRRMFLGVTLVLAACGSHATPTQPTPQPANIAGNWSGTFDYSNNGGRQAPRAILVNLTQAGSTVTGTYATDAFDGTVSGTTSPTSFTGTLTFNAVTVNGAACTGTMAVSGGAGSATMAWTSPAVTANCGNTPTAITITVQRR